MSQETPAPAAAASTSTMTSSTSPSTSESATSAAPSPSNYDVLSGETSHDPDNSFEGLGLDSVENLETSELAAPAPKAPAVQPQQPVVVQPAQPPQVPQQQTAQQPQVPATTEAQPAAQTTEVEAQPPSLDSVLKSFETRGPEIAQALASEFTIDPALAQELEENYAQAVPKLLSTVFVKAVQTSLSYMQQFVPQIVQQNQMQQAAYAAAEQKFFKQFPELNVSSHGNAIRMYAKAFASQNPGLTQDDLFSLVGNAVRTKFGLVGQPAPAQPQAQRQSAFVPAVGGGAPALTPAPDSMPFWGLGQDFDT